jgi:hypothetical protein
MICTNKFECQSVYGGKHHSHHHDHTSIHSKLSITKATNKFREHNLQILGLAAAHKLHNSDLMRNAYNEHAVVDLEPITNAEYIRAYHELNGRDAVAACARRQPGKGSTHNIHDAGYGGESYIGGGHGGSPSSPTNTSGLAKSTGRRHYQANSAWVDYVVRTHANIGDYHLVPHPGDLAVAITNTAHRSKAHAEGLGSKILK